MREECEPLHLIHATSDDSNKQAFELYELMHQTTELDDHGKLLLGGSKAGTSALAQVSIIDQSVEFAQTYSQAESVVAVIHAPKGAYIAVAITMRSEISTAFVIETDHDGNLVQEPIEVTSPALASSDSSLEHTLFSLSFDANGNVVIAIGHKNIKTSSEVVVVNLIDRSIIKRVYIESFLLTGGNNGIAT